MSNSMLPNFQSSFAIMFILLAFALRSIQNSAFLSLLFFTPLQLSPPLRRYLKPLTLPPPSVLKNLKLSHPSISTSSKRTNFLPILSRNSECSFPFSLHLVGILHPPPSYVSKTPGLASRFYKSLKPNSLLSFPSGGAPLFQIPATSFLICHTSSSS